MPSPFPCSPVIRELDWFLFGNGLRREMVNR